MLKSNCEIYIYICVCVSEDFIYTMKGKAV